MKNTAKRIMLALATTAVMLSVLGCREVHHGEVPTPPEGMYTAEQFVSYFKDEKKNNEYRVKDWAEDGTLFTLRLADIRVGDETLTYETGLWRTRRSQGLLVECTFADKGLVRQINNGDTVDIAGRTTEAKEGPLRIILKMDNCQVRKIDVGSQ